MSDELVKRQRVPNCFVTKFLNVATNGRSRWYVSTTDLFGFTDCLTRECALDGVGGLRGSEADTNTPEQERHMGASAS